MQEPLCVIVSRSGVTDTVPGRAVNVCERGIAAVLAGELMPGESVAVEVRISPATEPLRTQATVRYQDKLCCGLEFTAISTEQRSAIRSWVREAKSEFRVTSISVLSQKERTDEIGEKRSGPSGPPPPRRHRRSGWLIAVVVIAVAAGIFWWKWNRGWRELESGLRGSERFAAERPQVQVPAEVMEKLLVHRVEPVYPAEARKENLHGVLAVDIVVDRDGSVISMRALNGPEVLSRAAMDALRWWKFEPYRLNGEPAVVETTVAVEFKR
jgi:TonB family protein